MKRYSQAIKNTLRKIHQNVSHRASWSTYDTILNDGLACMPENHNGNQPYKLTDKGRQVLGV